MSKFNPLTQTDNNFAPVTGRYGYGNLDRDIIMENEQRRREKEEREEGERREIERRKKAKTSKGGGDSSEGMFLAFLAGLCLIVFGCYFAVIAALNVARAFFAGAHRVSRMEYGLFGLPFVLRICAPAICLSLKKRRFGT